MYEKKIELTDRNRGTLGWIQIGRTDRGWYVGARWTTADELCSELLWETGSLRAMGFMVCKDQTWLSNVWRQG